jgi:hypothetical protein
LVASFSKVILRPGHRTALALSVLQGRHGELVGVEEFRIGPEPHGGAGIALADGADHFQLRGDFAVLEADVVFLAVALDPALELLRQRVDHRHADAVQAAGDLVVLVAEFSAGMQARENELDAAHLFFRVNVHRHAATVVGHGQGVVLVQRDVDFLRVARERLVDRVVDDFVCEVVGTRGVGVHARAAAHGFETGEDFDVGCGVRHSLPCWKNRCAESPRGAEFSSVARS